jgi:hypothetical protein
MAIYGPEKHTEVDIYGVTYHRIAQLVPYTLGWSDGHAHTVQGETVTTWYVFDDVMFDAYIETHEVPE